MKLRVLLLTMSLCVSATTALGSFEHRGPDARVEAMGGAGVALANNPFGLFYNPASGNFGNDLSAGISYAVPFGNNALDSFYGVIDTGRLPFDRNGSAAISCQYYGSSLYRETSTFFTYSTKLAGPVHTGISAGLLERDAGDTGSESALGINLGALAFLSPDLNLGVAFLNVNRPDTGDGGEKAPFTTLAGTSYRPVDAIVLAAGVEKQEDKEIRLRSGGEVRVISSLTLRAGFTTAPSTFSGGAGFTFKNFQADFSLVRHPELGTGSWYTVRASF